MWSCPECIVAWSKWYGDRQPRCGAVHGAAGQSPPQTPYDLSAGTPDRLASPATGSWVCLHCTLRNSHESQACAACGGFRCDRSMVQMAMEDSHSAPATVEVRDRRRHVRRNAEVKERRRSARGNVHRASGRRSTAALLASAERRERRRRVRDNFLRASGRRSTAAWSCSQCTLINQGVSVRCSACHSVRPGATGAEREPGLDEVLQMISGPGRYWRQREALDADNAIEALSTQREARQVSSQNVSVGGGVELSMVLSQLPSSIVGAGRCGEDGEVVDLTISPRSSGGSCSICLEEFEYGAEKLTLPCFHEFHRGCCAKWFQTAANTAWQETGHTSDRGGRPRCPVCKTDVAEALRDSF